MGTEPVAAAFARARRITGGARDAFLNELPPSVRGEVEELLRHHDSAAAAALDAGLEGVAAGAWNAAVAGPVAIEGYRVVRRLGAGGMGTVFEAEQDAPRRRVALKLLHLPTAEGRRRFAREAELLARLRHPGIAQIHAQGETATPHGPVPFSSWNSSRAARCATVRRRSTAPRGSRSSAKYATPSRTRMGAASSTAT